MILFPRHASHRGALSPAWEEIFDAIAATGDPVSGQDLYFWARRWQTTCLAWIAAVTRGLTALQPELDNYLTFLKTSGEPD